MSNEKYDVTIIGSGPAGLTAAIYTSRAFLKTLVLAGDTPGGQLMLTTEVENFPGFDEGIEGPELMDKMINQAKKFGTEFVNVNVTKITGSFEKGFTLETNEGNKYLSKTIIISTGASAKWLGLESEKRLMGKGVSACATCDGFFFMNKEVAVVGGGDAAMEEATFLTKFATKVYVLVRGEKEKLRASKIMQKKAFDNPKIQFLFNTEVVEVLGENSVSGLKIINNKTNQESVLDVQGLFVAIGHSPNTVFLRDIVELDHVGYVVVQDSTKTNVKGIFVAGDVADHKYRQAVTAAGAGTMAALDAEKLLSESVSD